MINKGRITSKFSHQKVYGSDRKYRRQILRIHICSSRDKIYLYSMVQIVPQERLTIKKKHFRGFRRNREWTSPGKANFRFHRGLNGMKLDREYKTFSSETSDVLCLSKRSEKKIQGPQLLLEISRLCIFIFLVSFFFKLFYII